eukprot:6468087-Amphidinium_carterae.1
MSPPSVPCTWHPVVRCGGCGHVLLDVLAKHLQQRRTGCVRPNEGRGRGMSTIQAFPLGIGACEVRACSSPLPLADCPQPKLGFHA